VAGEAELRGRVSWPVVVRATGLGEISGGEIVLIPEARLPALLTNRAALGAAGVAFAIVFGADGVPGDLRDALGVGYALLPRESDVRDIRGAIEQSIIRRRRSLFELGQRLHHRLVDAAIGGAAPHELLEVAAAEGVRVALDREGEVLTAGLTDGISQDTLLAARIATAGSADPFVSLVHPKTVLSSTVVAGKERLGIALVFPTPGDDRDELEAVLSSLVAGLAIALSRDVDERPPTVEELMQRLEHPIAPSSGAAIPEAWRAMAVRDAAHPGARIERALGLEFTARDIQAMLARSGEVVVAVFPARNLFNPPSFFQSVTTRLGSASAAMGLSRQRGGRQPRKAVDEALHALRRSEQGVLSYEDIEVDLLLERVDDWETFVTSRLGPLLDADARADELLHTLDIYLHSGRQGAAAARTLQLHRNTLLYRLHQIQKALGTDLADDEDVFALLLAIRLLRAHGGRFPRHL